VSKCSIPSSWITTSVGDVSGKCKQRKPSEDESFFYVDIGSIDRKLKTISNPQKLSGQDAPSRARKEISAGDVIVSLTRPNLNAVALIDDKYDGQIASTGFEVLKPIFIESRYLFSVVLSKDFIDGISGKVQGALYPAAKAADVRNFSIPLPPLAEQKQIADKLDTLLAQVERTKTRLDAIPKILKQFRQSVLAAAVSGKLTEDWREVNTNISNVLYNIDKFDLIKKDKKSEALSSKGFSNGELLFDIPKSWVWVRLCRISEVVSGIAKGVKTNEETVDLPYLRVANVQRGYLNLSEIKTILVPVTRAKKLYLKSGDILFNEGGDLDKLGRGWVWEDQIKRCIHQNHVFRARLYSNDFNPRFISYYGNSAGREYFIKAGSQTVNLANINKTSLSLLPVPVPPKEEQTEIVRRVEELFGFADRIEARVKKAQGHVNHLTQSILAKAFRGELTADWRKQNPDLISGENSAQSLLDKIKIEREKLKPVKKKRTTKKKKTG